MSDDGNHCNDCKREIATLTAQMVGVNRRLDDTIVALHRDVELATVALKYQLEHMNEFRAQILLERGSFVTKVQYEAHIKENDNYRVRLHVVETWIAGRGFVESDLRALRDYVNTLEGKTKASMWFVAIGVGMAAAIIVGFSMKFAS